MSVVNTFHLLILNNSSDPFGKADEKEPLTNAVRSDSAVIGGVIARCDLHHLLHCGHYEQISLPAQADTSRQPGERKEYPEHLDSSF
uniref:Uncharacterized protein n=1 Tax=Sphaerodactylus townsendi TaxID=933632 RepID=A0ACB8G245_9SAUR